MLESFGVNYVEPNLVNGIVGDDGQTYEVTPNYEDFCVVVNIGVTIDGKRYGAESTVGGDKFTLTWNASGTSVNFMQGTKILYDSSNPNGEYINSLTTNYTDLYIGDYLKNTEQFSTNEMFGIESISINYDNYYVPMVTVKFIDIRGMSLFTPEEIRHRNIQNGIYGSVDNDVEGSFFKSFFTFPYPKFDLMVKGVYGKPIVFELSVSDWRATFDCSRGSFGCEVNFIGYSYALLSDITLNALIAATESDYFGKKYFNTNNNFTYHEGTKIKSFKEFFDLYRGALGEIEKVSSSSIEAERLKELNSESTRISNVLNSYNTFKAQFDILYDTLKNNNDSRYKGLLTLIGNNEKYGETYILLLNNENLLNTNDSNSIVFQVFNSSKVFARTLLNDPTYSKLGKDIFKDWFDTSTFSNSSNNTPIVEFKDVSYYDKIPTTSSSIGTTLSNYEKIYKFGIGYEESNSVNLTPYRGNGIVMAINPKKLGANLQQKLDSITQEINEINEKISKQNKQTIVRYLGFKPDVENLIRMICAHIDTLLHCIYAAEDGVMNVKDSRDASKFQYSDFISNDEASNGKTFVPPFPKVTRDTQVNDPDTTVSNNSQYLFKKTEDGWIGEVLKNCSPEADLVCGLLNGVKNVHETLDATSEAIASLQNPNNNPSRNYKLRVFTTPFDCLNDNIIFQYNDDETLDLNSETLSRIVLRAYEVIGAYGIERENMIKLIAEGDAINFNHVVGDKITNKFRNYIKSNTSTNIINYSDGKNSNEKVYAWGTDDLFLETNSVTYINDKFLSMENNNGTKSSFFPLSKVRLSEIKNLNYNSYPINKQNDVLTYNYTSPNNSKSIHDKYVFHIAEGNEKDDVVNKISCLNNEKNNLSSDLISSAEELVNNVTQIPSHEDSYVCPSDLTLDHVSKLFGNYEIYNENNMEKARMFLTSLFNSEEDAYQKVKDLINSLINDKETKIYSKPIVLLVGYYFKNDRNFYKEEYNIKDEFKTPVVNEFIDMFDKWFNSSNEGGFKYFLSKLSLSEQALTIIRNKETDYVNKLNQIEGFPYVVQNNSKIGRDFSLNLVFSTSNEGLDLSQSINNFCDGDDSNVLLMKSVAPYMDNDRRATKPFVHTSNINLYTNTFLSKLVSLWNEEENTTSEEDTTVEDPLVTKDIKITLYNYLKLLYDRWLRGKRAKALEEWSYDNLLNKFVIIDSFYFKVGKHVPFNIEQFFNRVKFSLEQKTYSLASFINDVLSDNDMSFLSIQNFADLSNKNLFNEMFSPIPYNKIGSVEPRTNFVCLYTYKASNHLNNENSDFKGDSFLLNDENDLAGDMSFLSTKNDTNGYQIPAFGVSYGKQYQSYFTSISPSMESPIMTEQSLNAEYILAMGASDGSKKLKFYGQDLYSVYSNNSYTCTVEMIGCAWVQPLMYFVLLNVPLFRGSYLIQKVSHTISQGSMVTTFVGTRMNRTCTPFTEGFFDLQDNNQLVGGSVTHSNYYDESSSIKKSTCSYDVYNPSSELNVAENNSNVNKGIDYYKNTTLGDIGINSINLGKERGTINVSDWSLFDGICQIVNGEARGEGELGQQLVTTVILNRSVAANGWKNVFNVQQFNGLAYEGGINQEVRDSVEKVLSNGPQILLNKTAVPKYEIDVYSQSKHIGKATNVTLTQDNLSKIYMFNNLAGYKDAPLLGGANPIKTTIYAFTHGNHVFHYGPNTDSNTSFWKTEEISKTDQEDNLSYYPYAYGLYLAIKKTCKTSENLNTEVSLPEDRPFDLLDEDDVVRFYLTAKDKLSLNKVFDAILDCYFDYIEKLDWITYNDASILGENPYLIGVTCGDGVTNRNVRILQYNESTIPFQTVNEVQGINSNFLTSLAKHYPQPTTDVAWVIPNQDTFNSFKKECSNFVGLSKEEMYKFIIQNYNFFCDSDRAYSNTLNNSNGYVVEDSSKLPATIAFPIDYLNNGGLNYINLSSLFGEPRETSEGGSRRHNGIDLGVLGNSNLNVLAILDGVVEAVNYGSRVGTPFFVIRHDNVVIGGKTLYSRYLHCVGGNDRLRVGDVVTKGQPIKGIKVGGEKGYALHLHFEMCFIEGSYSDAKAKEGAVNPMNYYYFGDYKKNLASLTPDNRARLGHRV